MSGTRELPDEGRRSIDRLAKQRPYDELFTAARSAIPETTLEKIEGAVGLTKRNSAFRTAIADALVLLITYDEPQQVNKLLAEAEKAAVAAVVELERLSAVLYAARLVHLARRAAINGIEELRAYVRHVGRLKKALSKNTGGRSKMDAFDGFIRVLADAYDGATGRSFATVSYDGTQYGGPFWDLVEAMRIRADKIAELSGGGVEYRSRRRGRRAASSFS